ncbi:MAG: hypothetical protein JW800_01550 [Candidatus Omnitrophica bacterium]|nr:hypothetical protein [Candidatus Omnitrophota bacterium]
MFSSYIDKELTKHEEDIFNRHISSCQECRKSLREYEKSWEMLSAWGGISPSPGYESRFWTRLTTEPKLREKFYGKVMDIIRPKRLVYVFTTALLLFLLINAGMYKYNELQARNMLINLDEEEWGMLEDYDLLAHLDTLNGTEKIQ